MKVAAYIRFEMAEIINLKRARKARSRVTKEAEAKANRLAHGRTKTERQQTKAEAQAAEKKLDGHKRDDS